MSNPTVNLRAALATSAAVYVAAGVVWARQAQPPAQSVPPETPALAGPKVVESPRPRSLVNRDYEGRIRPLDTTPEEAALALIDLDDQTRTKTSAIITNYSERLDAIVASNLSLLIKLETSKGGSREDLVDALREWTEQLRPLRDKGGLKAEISRALTNTQRTTFDAILKEYWDAVIDDTAREMASKQDIGPGAGGAEGPRRRAAIRAALIAMGQEIKRSYERQIGAREAAFKDAAERLGLSPEQDAKVRKIFTDLYIETLGKPTPEQRRAAVLKAYAELTPDQRMIVARELLERPQGPK